MELTQEQLKELLHYDPETGIFRWRKSTTNRVNPWSVAGCLSRGYLLIRINNHLYASHRLAWLYSTGKWPLQKIDHFNGCRSDNSLKNLRPATSKQNAENQPLNTANKSGFRGVCWYKALGKWKASVQHNKKSIHVGYFDDVKEAAKAADEKRAELFTHDTGRDKRI